MRQISYSQIDTFLRCQRKWGYAYQERLVPIEPSDALILGSAIHEGASAYYQGKTEEEVISISKNAYLKAQSEFALITFDIPELLPVMMKRFIAYSREYDPVFVDILPEQEISTIVGYSKLVGRVDAIGITKDSKRYLLELKTSSQPKSILSNLPFNLQIKIYSYILQKSYEPVDEVLIKILRKAMKSQEPLVVSDSHRPRIDDKIESYINFLPSAIEFVGDAYVHFPTYQYTCYQCQYRSLCSEEDPEILRQYKERDFMIKIDRDSSQESVE